MKSDCTVRKKPQSLTPGILIPFRVRLLGVLTKESQTTQKAGHR